jgi:hypothetical protein
MCFKTSWKLSILAFATVGPIVYLTQVGTRAAPLLYVIFASDAGLRVMVAGRQHVHLGSRSANSLPAPS